MVSLPPKRTRGFRNYALETAGRVRFIKRAQAFGMSLKEVQHLFRLDSKGACADARAVAAAKLDVVERKLSDLVKLRDALQGLVEACN